MLDIDFNAFDIISNIRFNRIYGHTTAKNTLFITT